MVTKCEKPKNLLLFAMLFVSKRAFSLFYGLMFFVLQKCRVNEI